MAFPTSPTNGQQVTVNGITYTYASSTQSWARVQGVAGNITATGNISANNYTITGTGIFWGNGSPAVYGTSFWVQDQDFGFTANTADFGNVLGLVTESVDDSYDNGSVQNGAAVAASNIIDFWDTSSSNYKVGFRNIPPVGTKTSSYTLAVGDVGKYVQVSTGGSITIPTTTFSEGDVVSIANNTTGNVTITCSAPTTYITGNNTVRTSLTLATRGLATVFFISNSICFIGGSVS
jgi:hypothetical protein